MQLAATRKGGKKRCSGRPRLVELQSGFSRASRSPALRRLAKLPPLASARKQHSADRSKACELTTYALSERSLWRGGAATAEAASFRAGRLRLAQHCKLQKTIFEKRLQTTQAYELQKPQNHRNRRKTRPKNNYSLSTLPRHYTASGLLNLQTTLTKSRNPCHSGCEVAFAKVKVRGEK